MKKEKKRLLFAAGLLKTAANSQTLFAAVF